VTVVSGLVEPVGTQLAKNGAQEYFFWMHRQARRYVEVQIHWFLIGLEYQVAAVANQDPEVKEDKAVSISAIGPAQGPSLVETVEESTSCKAVVGLREPDADAIINEAFEKWEAGYIAWNQAFYFKEAGIEVGIVDCGASAHGTARLCFQKVFPN
jgi:hypothetical protein